MYLLTNGFYKQPHAALKSNSKEGMKCTLRTEIRNIFFFLTPLGALAGFGIPSPVYVLRQPVADGLAVQKPGSFPCVAPRG